MSLRRFGKSLITNLYYAFHRITKDAFIDQGQILSNHQISTLFDVGAYIGQTTADYMGLFPQATIYSFEPFPLSFQNLHQRFKESTLVRPTQLAISNKTGEQNFYVNQNSQTNSLLPTTAEVERWINSNAIKTIDVIEVPTITIDDFCKQHSIDGIQVLKMDIQGAELMALEGATEQLSRATQPSNNFLDLH